MSDPRRESNGSDYELADLDPELARPVQSAEPAPIPVPASPLRTCATCGYALTGLTSRRCPECGTPFSLLEGRNVTILPTTLDDDHRAIRFERTRFAVGLAALIIGWVAPWIDRWGNLTFVRGLFFTTGNIFFVKFLLDYKVRGAIPWADWLLRAGLLALVVGALSWWLF